MTPLAKKSANEGSRPSNPPATAADLGRGCCRKLFVPPRFQAEGDQQNEHRPSERPQLGDPAGHNFLGRIFRGRAKEKAAEHTKRLHDTSPHLRNSAEAIVPRPDTGSSTSQVATGSRNFAEIQNPTENGVQHADTEPKSEPPEPTAGTVKDSILPNLSAVLDVVQQVGKILESVPYIEPIGAILSAGVKVYKEVEDNSGEQDALLKKVNTLNQHLEKARSGLEKIDQAEAGNDDVGLASDVNAYMDKLKDVKQLLTQSAERGWIKRTIQRGAIATELDSLKQNLSLFSDMFSEDRLIAI